MRHAAAALLAVAALLLTGCAGERAAVPAQEDGKAPAAAEPAGGGAPAGSTPLRAGAAAPAESAAAAEATARAGQPATALPPRPWAFSLSRRAQLRDRPGGKVLATLRTKTEFGTRRILGVAARRDGWVAVRSELLPNGKLGWVPEAAGVLMTTPSRVEVDLSRRVLLVHRRDAAPLRFRVAIGAPGSATPPGRYAVTDRLTTGTTVGPYGCCVLALTGRQPNLPQGWGGGDRLAIHGTAATGSIGQAASHGCVRATNATMRRLFDEVLLGAPVWVHA